MARDKDEDDLYDEEFDFVDDDEFEEEESDEEGEEVAKKPKKAAPRKSAKSPKKKSPKATPRKRSPRKHAEEEAAAEVPDFDEVEAGEEPAAAAGESEGEESLDEFGRPAPVANYVVHVYEHRKFKRTIDRDFTPEDADAFATDYNRYARNYGRIAVAGKKDVPPKKSVEMPAHRTAQIAGDSTLP